MDRLNHPHEDEVAITHLDVLVERAERNGISARDLTAPEGLKLGRHTLPWVGALKSSGIRNRPGEGSRAYRLYFAETTLSHRSLLAAKLSWKCTSWADDKTKKHQTHEVKDAVGITERYCREQGCDCRRIVTSP
ncbi:hypothetical protein DW322_11060 [Rhodococcus rhodnii]|uniref:Uncharacterized protein n=2 Tax=Rhodococcus rhodnii TaxID=38312 RepID=A0A6P2CCK3_9NOCA|nr:hypothetical protein DW322_08635 [Rhodococcus rhodnii]TXG90651.1 hypothetical protein DW322_11060 [Rhodococcus rhodnii]